MSGPGGWLVALSLGLLAAPVGSVDGARPCGDTGMRVRAAAAVDLRDACRAVRAAEAFVRSAGLQWPRDLVLEIGSAGEPALAEEAVGQYDQAHRRLRVRAFVELSGHLPSRALWRSYVVHEIAHAAVHRTCDRNCPRRAIHEYVAAAAQLASLSERERRHWLDRYPDLTGFAREDEITETYYDLNPQQFAVQAYRHYRRQADPAAFLRRQVGWQ